MPSKEQSPSNFRKVLYEKSKKVIRHTSEAAVVTLYLGGVGTMLYQGWNLKTINHDENLYLASSSEDNVITEKEQLKLNEFTTDKNKAKSLIYSGTAAAAISGVILLVAGARTLRNETRSNHLKNPV